MRVVVDTNVLVSALILTHGRVGPVLLRLRDGANLIVTILLRFFLPDLPSSQS